MKLDIYISKINMVARDKVIDEVIKRAEDKNEKFWVIAPETLSLSIERRILEKSKRKAFFNVEVLSFARLFNKFAEGKYDYVSAQTGIMIVKKIILENLDKLVCFKKTAKSQGFVEEIYATIQQLKSSEITPEDLMMMSNSKSVSLKIKMQDILLIYSKYEEILKGQRVDDSGRLGALAKILENTKELKDINIVLVSHENWTRQMKSIIKILLKEAKSIICGVTYLHPDCKNAYITENECFEYLKEIGDEFKLKYEPILVEENLPVTQRHILNNLYAYPYDRIESNGSLSVFEAENPTSEIEFVASSISREVICSGARYKDFAIACSNIESYSATIKKVFADYGLPIFIDEKTSLGSHFVIQFIMDIFNIAKKNFDAEDVVAFSKNILNNDTLHNISNFENYIKKFGINHNDFKESFFLGSKGSESEKLEFENAEETRRCLFLSINEIVAKINMAETFYDFFKAVYAIIDNFCINERINKIKNCQKDSGYIEESKVSEQVLSKLIEFINEATAVLCDQKVDINEFLSLFASGISSLNLSLIPVSVDKVFVGDLSKCGEVNTLFIIGMNEGMMPKVSDDCGVISDVDINLLSVDFNKKIEPSIKTVNRREKWKFFQGVFNGKDKIYFVYPRFDFSGSEVAPSQAVRDALKLFTSNGMPIEKETINKYKVKQGSSSTHISEPELAFWYPNQKKAIKELVRNVSLYKDNVDFENYELMQNLYFALESGFSENTLEYFEKINQNKIFEEIQNASKLFFPKGKTSISQVESYFDCPFKHFIRFGLRAKQREEAGIKSVDIGDIIHSVCEKFVKYLKKVGKVEFDTSNVAEQILQEVLDEDKYKAGMNKFLEKLIKLEVVRVCTNIQEEQSVSEFIPYRLEAEFKDNREFKPINFDNVDIKVEGKIDRIDNYANFFFAVDYKTGAKQLPNYTKLYYGKQSQLFIYLEAIKQNIKESEFVGAFYLPIRNTFETLKKDATRENYKMCGFVLNDDSILGLLDSKAKENKESLYFPFNYTINKKGEVKINTRLTNLLEKKEFEVIKDYVCKITSIAIKEILSGYITPSPLKMSSTIACDKCECRWICRARAEDCQRNVVSKTKKYFMQKGGDE